MIRTCIPMLVAFVLLPLILPSGATLSCRTACRKCSEKREHQALLEVYCAMCRECRERRRAWQQLVPRSAAPAYDGPNCPSPPPCDSDLEDVPEQMKSTIETTSPTTTTEQHHCPETPKCKEQPVHQPCCVPMCPFPTHTSCPTPAAVEKMTLPDTTTVKEYVYIHVGVPKALLNKL